MNEKEAKNLCIALMKADSEQEVIALLTKAGYWDNPDVWRYYGDKEDNYSTAGNQQSHPEAALVEKLVNAVDAKLMNAASERGISLDGKDVPQSIHEAVSVFFDGKELKANPTRGRISNWTAGKRTRVAQGITFAATGALPRTGDPSFIIADNGEGQTPSCMPDTLLSLDKKIKMRINFVQGKFNMGGTGALKFCGRHNLQLIVSKRNPKIAAQENSDPSAHQWGFAVVRREDPCEGRRMSVYTYLAPLDSRKRPRNGDVLRFASRTLTIFPDKHEPYSRRSEWGTVVKLYEYSVPGHRSHILMPDGILGRMDLLLAEAGLPIRFHECRVGYRGHKGSFETTMSGIVARLEDDKAANLEFPPSSCSMMVAGEPMTAKVFAFKKGKAETYRKREGIVFTINGQTHGHLTPDFFRRNRVGLSYLADSILVIVDCTHIGGRSREDLFMNSRDRLSGCELRYKIEHELENLLKNHQGLRELRERRRREEVESKLSDEQPLEDILDALLNRYPSLSNLFRLGKRINKPFKTSKQKREKAEFRGKRYPTYFKFRDKKYGTVLHRECPINRRCKVSFETDAVDDYFDRAADQGSLTLEIVHEGGKTSVVHNRTMNLFEGSARLTMTLPEMVKVGDQLQFVTNVTDSTRTEPFQNSFIVTVVKASDSKGTKGTQRKRRSSQQGGDHEGPENMALPNIVVVKEQDWADYTPPFDQYTALRIKHTGNGGDDNESETSEDVYDFFINIDNVYLNSELKSGSSEIELARARFKYGLVLIGLAMIQGHSKDRKREHEDDGGRSEQSEERDNVEEEVAKVTRAIAPILLPAIESLGSLDVNDCTYTDDSGEAT